MTDRVPDQKKAEMLARMHASLSNRKPTFLPENAPDPRPRQEQARDFWTTYAKRA